MSMQLDRDERYEIAHNILLHPNGDPEFNDIIAQAIMGDISAEMATLIMGKLERNGSTQKLIEFRLVFNCYFPENCENGKGSQIKK